jgi:hypothetical protein
VLPFSSIGPVPPATTTLPNVPVAALAPSTPITKLSKGFVYAHQIDPSFSPTTIGKWLKSSIPSSNGKGSRELVVSLVGQPLEDVKERFKKTVGTEATTLVGEMTKTLQLLVLQRQDDQRLVEVSQHQIKRYLFSTYYPDSGFVNGDRDPNEPCKIVSVSQI